MGASDGDCNEGIALALIVAIIIVIFVGTVMTRCRGNDKPATVPTGMILLDETPKQPPEGWTIQYNTQTHQYRWVRPNGHEEPLEVHKTLQGAIDNAWDQYQYEQKLEGAQDKWETVKLQGGAK